MEELYPFPNIMKKLLYGTLILLVSSSIAWTQEPDITYLDTPYGIELSTSKDPKPIEAIPIEQITDSLSDNKAGHTAIHQVGFQLPHFDGEPVGLLRGRQVVITFPPEFDVSQIQSVAYFDTDHDADDPAIREVYIYSHSVVVRFKDKVPGPEASHFAYLLLESMDNPTVARDYQIVVQIDNLLGQTIAGLGFSERFVILPDEAQYLEIAPTESITLRAGEGLSFKASGVDQYGNPITTDMVDWSLDPDLDPVGRLYDNFLLATTVGAGRVIARYDDLEESSGLITVLPGEFAALSIEVDETQFAGNAFRGLSRVTALDAYGNIVIDYNETGPDLFLSSSPGIIEPGTIPASEFVDGVAALNNYVYRGDPGPVRLTVSDGGAIEESVEFYANGVHAVFDDGYYLPEWILTAWDFYARCEIWNPANLTPVELVYEAGFVDSDAPPADIIPPRNCIPLPMNAEACQFRIRQVADMTPGAYQYVVTINAVYEYESESFTAQWSVSRDIQVDEFTPFTFEVIDLPSSGFAEDYTDSGSIRLLNTNIYDRPILVISGLAIKSELHNLTIAGDGFTFHWESEKVIDLELHFSPEIPPDTYAYLTYAKAQYYPDDHLWRIAYNMESDLDAQIEIAAPELKAVQIVSVTNSAINSPFVNTGQEFHISGAISNLTSLSLEGPFVFELVGDGQSTLPPPIVLPSIPPTDTPLVLSFPVTAGTEPNPAEVFTLKITEAPDNVRIIPPLDDYAVAVIQTPARLTVIAEVLYHPGPVISLGFGEPFEISGGYLNSGQASVDGGTLVLDYAGPGDFGIDFPDEQPFDPEPYWQLTAPYEEIASYFEIGFGDLPIDLNTGQPAIITVPSVQIDFELVAPETKLIVEAGGFGTAPLERGVSGKLFNLTLQNNTTEIQNTLGLEKLEIEVFDRDGKLIKAEDFVDENPEDGTNFYLDGEPVSERVGPEGAFVYSFSDLIIPAGKVITIEYRLKPKTGTIVSYFTMRLDGDKITARIVEGPQTGQRVPVTGLLDRAFMISIPQSIIADEFAASFKNYPNPFNPNAGPTEIRYRLPGDSDVDIYVFSATGEEVRHMHFAAGENGGREGLNDNIFWDGHNGHGDMVLNGVYVAYIEVAAGGLKATVKMAVVK